MKKITIAAAILAASIVAPASATIMYDSNVTSDVIFGSGNINGAFTVDQNNGVEIGLRGKLRHNTAGNPENTFNSNGDGTYSFVAGIAPGQSSPTAVWSVEWSINTNFDGSSGFMLNDLTYIFSVDNDPSAASNLFSFDPINILYADHSIGTNTTGNGDGIEASDPAAYSLLLDDNNVAQNSAKAHWLLSSFDPTLDGTYDFMLSAYDVSGSIVASSSIQIIAGEGAKIPEPSSIALLLLGACGLVVRKKSR